MKREMAIRAEKTASYDVVRLIVRLHGIPFHPGITEYSLAPYVAEEGSKVMTLLHSERSSFSTVSTRLSSKSAEAVTISLTCDWSGAGARVASICGKTTKRHAQVAESRRSHQSFAQPRQEQREARIRILHLRQADKAGL